MRSRARAAHRVFSGGILLATLAGAPSAARDLAESTPASLLSPDETEWAFLGNVYTQTTFYDALGDRRDAGGRSSWWTAIASWTRGLPGRWNVGMDAALRSVDDEAAGQRVPAPETTSRTAIAWLAPRLEGAPWPAGRVMTAELSVRIPLEANLDGRDDGDADARPESPFLDTSDVTIGAKLRGDLALSQRSYAYWEAGGLARVDGRGANGGATSAKVLLHRHFGTRWTAYAPLEADVHWGGASTGAWSAQAGLGTKFRPAAGLELEAVASGFPAGRNRGAGQAFTLGVRIVR